MSIIQFIIKQDNQIIHQLGLMYSRKIITRSNYSQNRLLLQKQQHESINHHLIPQFQQILRCSQIIQNNVYPIVQSPKFEIVKEINKKNLRKRKQIKKKRKKKMKLNNQTIAKNQEIFSREDEGGIQQQIKNNHIIVSVPSNANIQKTEESLFYGWKYFIQANRTTIQAILQEKICKAQNSIKFQNIIDTLISKIGFKFIESVSRQHFEYQIASYQNLFASTLIYYQNRQSTN